MHHRGWGQTIYRQGPHLAIARLGSKLSSSHTLGCGQETETGTQMFPELINDGTKDAHVCWAPWLVELWPSALTFPSVYG